MTLNEAIKYYGDRRDNVNFLQILKWLKELQDYRSRIRQVYDELAHVLDAPNDIQERNVRGGVDIAVAILDKYFAKEDLET